MAEWKTDFNISSVCPFSVSTGLHEADEIMIQLPWIIYYVELPNEWLKVA